MNFIQTINADGKKVTINPAAIVCTEENDSAIIVTLDTALKVTISEPAAVAAFKADLESAE